MTREETLDTCLNTPEEVHALWIGVCTAWRQYHCTPVPADIPERNRLEIADEYPYYLAGFWLARWLQVVGLLICFGLLCGLVVVL